MNQFAKRYRKGRFYLSNVASILMPRWWYRRQLADYLDRAQVEDEDFYQRLEYYCQLNPATSAFDLGQFGRSFDDIPFGKQNTYYFDLRRIARYFEPTARLAYQFGDIREVPNLPTLVKSRPIAGAAQDSTAPIENHNSVLQKWNQMRHYHLVADPVPFLDKQAKAIWRGKAMGKANRLAFLERYHNSDICDAADTDPRTADGPYAGDFVSIRQQLKYRYIVSLEGRDVATNLKWIMHSQSLCLMARPQFETWFMEGRLEPNVHYGVLRDDHSDLAERIAYFEQHPDEAEQIIRNAQAWIAQFLNPQRELLLQIMVLDRYLQCVE